MSHEKYLLDLSVVGSFVLLPTAVLADPKTLKDLDPLRIKSRAHAMYNATILSDDILKGFLNSPGKMGLHDLGDKPLFCWDPDSVNRKHTYTLKSRELPQYVKADFKGNGLYSIDGLFSKGIEMMRSRWNKKEKEGKNPDRKADFRAYLKMRRTLFSELTKFFFPPLVVSRFPSFRVAAQEFENWLNHAELLARVALEEDMKVVAWTSKNTKVVKGEVVGPDTSSKQNFVKKLRRESDRKRGVLKIGMLAAGRNTAMKCGTATAEFGRKCPTAYLLLRWMLSTKLRLTDGSGRLKGSSAIQFTDALPARSILSFLKVGGTTINRVNRFAAKSYACLRRSREEGTLSKSINPLTLTSGGFPLRLLVASQNGESSDISQARKQYPAFLARVPVAQIQKRVNSMAGPPTKEGIFPGQVNPTVQGFEAVIEALKTRFRKGGLAPQKQNFAARWKNYGHKMSDVTSALFEGSKHTFPGVDSFLSSVIDRGAWPMLALLSHESGGNPLAINTSVAVGGVYAWGLFQFTNYNIYGGLAKDYENLFEKELTETSLAKGLADIVVKAWEHRGSPNDVIKLWWENFVPAWESAPGFGGNPWFEGDKYVEGNPSSGLYNPVKATALIHPLAQAVKFRRMFGVAAPSAFVAKAVNDYGTDPFLLKWPGTATYDRLTETYKIDWVQADEQLLNEVLGALGVEITSTKGVGISQDAAVQGGVRAIVLKPGLLPASVIMNLEINEVVGVRSRGLESLDF